MKQTITKLMFLAMVFGASLLLTTLDVNAQDRGQRPPAPRGEKTSDPAKVGNWRYEGKTEEEKAVLEAEERKREQASKNVRDEYNKIGKLIGTIKYITPVKGYAIILHNNTRTLFVDFFRIKTQLNQLKEGDTVTYDLLIDNRGEAAKNVRKKVN